jgi:hypothetical protein
MSGPVPIFLRCASVPLRPDQGSDLVYFYPAPKWVTPSGASDADAILVRCVINPRESRDTK